MNKPIIGGQANKPKVMVIGGGLVGMFMWQQLKNEGYQTVIADIDCTGFTTQDGHEGVELNVLFKSQLKRVITQVEPELVVLSVPGSIGYQALKNCIECGVDVVDISFFPENAKELDKLAKAHGCKVFVDMGLAPGIPGMILGHYSQFFNIERTYIEVGGVPVEPKAPWFYKAAFSPRDVIEEYTRPARNRYCGQIEYPDPLGNSYSSQFGEEYCAIATDGLRSLLTSFPNTNMIEVTTRDKRHIRLMSKMKDVGCFDKENLEDTSRALLDGWVYESGELDRILYFQELVTQNKDIVYHMEYTGNEDHSAMAATTGLVATGAVEHLTSNHMGFKYGINAPEDYGKVAGTLQHMFDYLRRNGINYKVKAK